MNEQLSSSLREAMRLMQSGDLMAATAEIQRRLGAIPVAESSGAASPAREPIEGVFRTLDPTPAFTSDTRIAYSPRDAADERLQSTFSEHVYTGTAGSRAYKLFVPSAYRGRPLPLVVMLHGCTQNPDDFATGTRMNVAAEARACFVVYPAQSAQANISKCWNWFQPGDQARDHGEPAIIAGLVRELSRTYRLDEERIYVAGMSAGGAMAVILGKAYPEIFAAVGVHSGMPYRAARDMPSAFAAMQRRSSPITNDRQVEGDGVSPPLVPTIVFHGDRDTTVHPGNGDQVIAEASRTDCAEFPNGSRLASERRDGTAPSGRSYVCTVFKDNTGRIVGEHWLAHGTGHAWCGGDSRGSFTDPAGPDATREMLRFFLERTRR